MRLLVVEDYEPLRHSLLHGLRKAGYAVDAVGDGEEALWLAEREAYDLLILDVMLPKLSGLDIVKRLREAGAEVPILMLSARDQTEDQVAGLDLGADDYLTKPFAVDALMARIRALLRRQGGKRNPSIMVGPLCIDTNARAVRCGDASLNLTSREYALLEYLGRHLGQVVSRSELWEHLYDFEAETSSNTLDQWISRLRRKIRALDAPDLIETVHGHGYRLVEPC